MTGNGNGICSLLFDPRSQVTHTAFTLLFGSMKMLLSYLHSVLVVNFSWVLPLLLLGGLFGLVCRDFQRGEAVFTFLSLNHFCFLLIFIVVCLLTGVINPLQPMEKILTMA